MVVEQYGASAAKIIFAVMGAFSAMEITIRASLRSCMTQISGVIVGVILSLLMRQLEINIVAAVALGIIFIMAMYQLLHWKRSPVLPCLILVTICTDSSVSAVTYGLARIWDTAIGLSIGMVINMLVFPYDNSAKIRGAIASLDGDLISFLEDLFDGDEHLPESDEMTRKIEGVEAQLALFADQRLFRWKRQKFLLSHLQSCEYIARALVVEVEALRNLEGAGRLNRENREKLRQLGAAVGEDDGSRRFSVEDLVVNYHVSRVLNLREQLKDELAGSKWK